MLSTGIKLYIEMHDTLFFFFSLFHYTLSRPIKKKKKGVGPAPKQPCVFVCLSRLGHERTQIVTLLKASLLYKFTSLFLAASAFRYCRQKQRRRKKKTKKKKQRDANGGNYQESCRCISSENTNTKKKMWAIGLLPRGVHHHHHHHVH